MAKAMESPSLALSKYATFTSPGPQVFAAAFNAFPTIHPLSTSNELTFLSKSSFSKFVLHPAFRTPPFVTSSYNALFINEFDPTSDFLPVSL